MTDRHEHFVYGPVPSRRLGRSLGVDVVPFKVCPFDCVYCQVGRTTEHTARRGLYLPAEAILAEVAAVLQSGVECDVITLSGSGEPTLHADLAGIIAGIQNLTDTPVAVLTNGALLGDADVRAALKQADIVVPSLDAGDAETFRRINRPLPGLDFETYVKNLRSFRAEYDGRMYLEVFLAAGVNDTDEQVRRIAEIARTIGPDRVDLNTVARPTADGGVRAVPPERLEHFREIVGPTAIVAAGRPDTGPTHQADRDRVLATLARRPCTEEDLAAGLGCHRNEVAKLVGQLLGEGLIRGERVDGRTYYRPG